MAPGRTLLLMVVIQWGCCGRSKLIHVKPCHLQQVHKLYNDSPSLLLSGPYSPAPLLGKSVSLIYGFENGLAAARLTAPPAT